MKNIILIVISILLFMYSCEAINQEEIHISGCEIDEDCIARIGRNYVCQDKSCKYNYCKTKS